MKIVINFDNAEKVAVENAVEAYKDICPKAVAFDEVEEAHKGFSIHNFFTRSGGYQMSVKIPDWVIVEYSELIIKYHGKIIQLLTIFKQMNILLGDWKREIDSDFKRMKEKHMK